MKSVVMENLAKLKLQERVKELESKLSSKISKVKASLQSMLPKNPKPVGFQPESDSVVSAKPVPKKNLYGVPVQAWILSRQNALAGPLADPHAADGMRVFVQCIELKKENSEFVGDKSCNEMLAKGQVARRALTTGQRGTTF